MKTLGVSLIVKNEAECIVPCLESLKGADEIVICDTGSTDNTVEICEKYGTVHTDYKWADHFSDARNHCLDKMTADWILIIDADEVLADSIEKIRKFINGPVMTADTKGILFHVITKTEKIQSCRIVKNTPEIRWKGAVHNVMGLNGSSPELRKVCWKTDYVINSGYSPAHLKDPDRSMRILKKELKKDPQNVRYLYYLAREYINRNMQSKDPDVKLAWTGKAVKLLEKYDKLACSVDWTNEYADAMYLLALGYTEQREWIKSVRAASWAFIILPSYKAISYFLSVAMNDPPIGMHKMPAHAALWKELSNRATNENVAQIRDIN